MKSLVLHLILLIAVLNVVLNLKMCEKGLDVLSILDDNKMKHSSRTLIATSLGTTKKSLDHHATDSNASKEKGTDLRVNRPTTHIQNFATVPRISSAAENKPNNNYWNNSSKPLLLIFKHNPKAGGGSIKAILEEFKPKTLLHKQVNYTNITDPNETFVRLNEFIPLRARHWKRGFVISSMREPCDQYLSLWAFGSNKEGKLYNTSHYDDPNWTMAAYGQDPPLFNSQRDIEAFRSVWLKDSRIQGLIAKRFSKNFGDNFMKKVDCWVFVDDFQGSLFSCLKQFENQGGWVDWNAPLLSALVHKVQERAKQRRLNDASSQVSDNSSHERRAAYNKDDPVGNPQRSHHSNCLDYFDDETAQYIENGQESFLYKEFGYKGCCKHGRL